VDTNSFRKEGMLKPIAGNVFKQMMAKLGFMLWRVDFKSQIKHPALSGEPTMFVGVDVCHDKKIKGAYGKSPRSGNSTVGFCASSNSAFTSYNSYISYQNKGEEYVRASKDLMKSSLEEFRKKK